MNKPRRIEWKDNPYYPLPPDYPTLTEEGMRLARIDAARQYQLHGPAAGMSDKEITDARRQRGEVYALCLRFFERTYLLPQKNDEGEVTWDPMFYDVEDPLPNPRFHDVMTAASIAYPRVAMVAPRGSSKSFWCARDMMLRLLARPGYSFIYATSTNDLAKLMGDRVRRQLYYNSRIQDDWAQEFGGDTMKPGRQVGATGVEYFQLTNGSWLSTSSARSKQRGARPRRYRLDDPEYDPDANTDMQELRAATDRLVFKVIMPMVMRAQCGIDWIGTYISRRHLLYHATHTHERTLENGSTVLVAEDPRFDSWIRINQPVMVPVGTEGKMQSCWPHMWPIDDEEKKRLVLDPDTRTIPMIRKEIGPASFASEYMNDPSESDQNYFEPLTLEKHGYRFISPDEATALDPWNSTAAIEYWDRGDRFTRPLPDFLEAYGPTFAMVDTSFTNKASSDYKAIVVCSRGPENSLFVWDVWSGKCDEAKVFVPKILELCNRWRVRFLGIETVRTGASLYGRLHNAIATDAAADLQYDFLPLPKKILVGVSKKEARIAQSLAWRVDHGKIKFPFPKRTTEGWGRLFNQMETWHPNVDGGGLQHDDEIDALHMHMFMLKGRLPHGAGEELVRDEKSALDRLRDKDYGGHDRAHLGQIAFNTASPSDLWDFICNEGGGLSTPSPKKPYKGSVV